MVYHKSTHSYDDHGDPFMQVDVYVPHDLTSGDFDLLVSSGWQLIRYDMKVAEHSVSLSISGLLSRRSVAIVSLFAPV